MIGETFGMTGKIFVCYHKKDEIIQNEVLTPISLNSNNIELDFCEYQDNVGTNIADYNYTFCELTALYWMWKNTDYDYIGLFHYRRLLYLTEDIQFEGMRSKFITISGINNQFDKYGLDSVNINNLMRKYDIILPKSEALETSVYEQYRNFSSHVPEHLDMAVQYIEKNHPEMIESVRSTLEGNKIFFCNMFVGKKKLIDEYCEWVFPILFHVIDNTNEDGLNIQQLRYAGFVSERLFTIYIHHLLERKELKIAFFKQLFIDRKEHSNELVEILKGKVDVAIFGTGIAAQDIINMIPNKIIVLIDNNRSKQGTFIKGIKVISLEQFLSNYQIPILICSSFYSEISEQLNNHGLIFNRDYFVMETGYLV